LGKNTVNTGIGKASTNMLFGQAEENIDQLLSHLSWSIFQRARWLRRFLPPEIACPVHRQIQDIGFRAVIDL
jgi:hypothetical protein